MLNRDFKEMLQCLLAEHVDFMLVGGYAMAAHGYPRATKDIDLWVWANPENAVRVVRALQAFGAPTEQFSVEDFSTPGTVFQLGVPPRRIDITTTADGISFDSCRQNLEHFEVDGIRIPLIAKGDLITNKLASGRPQDKLDAAVLAGRSVSK